MSRRSVAVTGARLAVSRAVLALLAPVCLLAVLELGSRLALAAVTRNPAYLTMYGSRPMHVYKVPLESHRRGTDRYYKGVPGLSLLMPGQPSPFRLTYNSRGYRGPEFEAAASRIRIACVGDSTVWGSEVENDQAWPAFLQARLEQQAPGTYEVINAGFPAYNLPLVLNLLRHELLAHEPDLVLLESGFNDHTGVPGGARYFFNTGRAEFLLKRMQDALNATSMLAYLVTQLASRGNPRDIAGTGARVARRYRERLEAIAELCRAHGVGLAVIRQPLDAATAGWTGRGSETGAAFARHYPDRRFTPETLERVRNDVRRGVSHATFARAYYYQAMVFEAIEAAAQARPELVVLDPVPALLSAQQRGAAVFRDIVHLTPAGNAMLAEQLVASLVSQRLLPAGLE
jgi:lysophospholipase L1-like esterase